VAARLAAAPWFDFRPSQFAPNPRNQAGCHCPDSRFVAGISAWWLGICTAGNGE